MAKTKVVVLGGGVGAMTAALRLTATKDLRDRYDVTVHQLGWRLGGKGASGRNAAHAQRIEEHGLHLWFGFYDNALRLMIDTYDALTDPAADPKNPEPGVMPSFDDAFHPCDTIALYDQTAAGDWEGVAMTWPRRGTAGSGAPLPGFWDVFVMALDLFRIQWAASVKANPQLGGKVPQTLLPVWMDPIGAAMGQSIDDALEILIAFVKAQKLGNYIGMPGGLLAQDIVADSLGWMRDGLWHLVASRQDDDIRVRMAFQVFDVITALTRGLVDEHLIDDPDAFDALNEHELSDWLRSHGLTTATYGATPASRAPVLRALYDVAFGYLDGDVQRPDIAAGTAINDLMRLAFTYHGALAYKMQAGMGDAVFTPFHKLLRRRGVKFEFFSAVTALHVDPNENTISAIDVVKQVETVSGKPYDPYVAVKGLHCWPSEPDWDQLVGGAAHQAAQVDFELEVNPLGRTKKTLKAGTDFDEVVLGISIGALMGPKNQLGHVDVAELCKRDATFAAAIKHAEVVRTQAFQLWIHQDSAADLGYAFDENSVAGCFVEPLDTYCDMTHLVAKEDWLAGEVASIAYFCGVLDHRKETHDTATNRVRKGMEEFCKDHIGGLWPKCGTGGATNLSWNRLVCKAGKVGADRLDSQYWRANTHGTELYVLTPQRSVKHRLPSGDTGFANLVAAGDWTRNGIDGGCVEAAAVSGIDAANAIITRHRAPTDPHPAPPVNVDPDWLRL